MDKGGDGSLFFERPLATRKVYKKVNTSSLGELKGTSYLFSNNVGYCWSLKGTTTRLIQGQTQIH